MLNYKNGIRTGATVDMKGITEFLIQMEDTARAFYEDASRVFGKDKAFGNFLKELADDEKSHHDILTKEAPRIEPIEWPVTIDDELREKYLQPFQGCREKMDEQSLSKEEVLDCIISVEFSEFNDIFLYIVNLLKNLVPSFAPDAAIIETHRKRITGFLEGLPDNAQYLKKIGRIPSVWREKILIVEDYSPMAQLLSAILSREGDVETAKDGREALKKMTEKRFSVILADVEMPHMDGIEFYNTAAKKDPDIKGRFVFISANAEYVPFFKKNSIPYILKPASINAVRKTVADCINKNAPVRK